ncbi:MAG: glycosyltransferase family 4 protein [Bacteroidia bacterium]|nr:glycosyltransferase family 4 protein [Bacteroidia bacterium]MCF8426178.1 glycosyltransferase family 4 protein [Bacteroidia bacterium]MCF8445526.1 glycosyltransferase family 4 protein [Bacteroidia bacterium]
MRRKIAIVHSSLDRGGLTKIIFYISKYINKSEFEIRIYTFSEASFISELPLFVREKIIVVCLNIGNDQLGLIKNLRNEIENYNPDLIHTHSFRGSLYTSVFLAKYLHLATIHGNLSANYVASYGSFKGKWIAFLEEYAFNKAAYKSIVSSSLVSYLKQKSNGRIIDNGIDSNLFSCLPLIKKIDLKASLGFSSKLKILVTHGGINKIKNIDFFLEAFVSSFTQFSFLVLVIGTGESEFELREKYKNRGDIIWLGYQEYPAPYLQIADYYISASLSEGMPNSALEALSCGLYPILSDIPAHQDLVSKSGVPHRLFSPTKSSELIQIFNNMPEPTPFKSNYDFSVERMVKEYEDFYRDIISGKEILN